jgi:hypothetical protein
VVFIIYKFGSVWKNKKSGLADLAQLNSVAQPRLEPSHPAISLLTPALTRALESHADTAIVRPSRVGLNLLRSWMRQKIFSNSPLCICLTAPYCRSAMLGATALSTSCHCCKRHRIARAPEIRRRVEPFLKPLLGVAQPPSPSPSLECQRRSVPSCRAPHWRWPAPTPCPRNQHLLEHLPTLEHLPETLTSILCLSCGLPPVSLFDRRTPQMRSRPDELPSLPLPKMVSPPHRLSPQFASPPPRVAYHRIHAPSPPRTMPSTSPISFKKANPRWPCAGQSEAQRNNVP